MFDQLTQARSRLLSSLNRERSVVEPLVADPWVANSLLQKSIRRGEVNVAQRAALTFLGHRGPAIWRRMIIIAFEDVGAASPDAVATTVAVSSDARWRKQLGGDAAIAVNVARLLAEAPKSRSAEHLITAATQHSRFEPERCFVNGRSHVDNLSAVGDESLSLVHRGIAARRVSGVGRTKNDLCDSDLPGLLKAFAELGVPGELAEATGIAVSRVRDAITLMVPLMWHAANDGRATVLMETDVPRSLVLNGVPMYAMDKHTRTGREAIRELVKYNHEIRECLERYVAPVQRHDAAYMAAFYADAAPLACKLVWKGGDELEALGTEADLFKVGVPPEGVSPLLRVFRESVPHLNKLRAHTVCKKRGFVEAATALMADGEE